MTPDDIRKLPPGRDTDAMVAGVLKILARRHGDGAGDLLDWPTFTADTPEGWAASQECWEWLTARGWWPIVDGTRVRGKVVAGIFPNGRLGIWDIYADHLPHAIALLVLLVAQAEGLLT